MYKKLLDNKKAVLFDLDGTIVETEIYWKTALMNIVSGIAPNADEHYEIGTSMTEIVKTALDVSEAGKGHSVKEIVDRVNAEYARLIKEAELEPKPGFWDLVFELKEDKHLPIGLVTNTADSAAKAVMAKLGILNIFDITVFGNNVVRPKPDPEIYNMAARKLKLRGNQVLVFEDSIAGVTAALKAHMDVVAILNGDSDAYDYPEKILLAMTDFDQLAGNMDTDYIEDMKNFSIKYHTQNKK